MNDPVQSSKSNSLLFLAACALFMFSGIMLLAWLGTPPISPVVGKRFPKIELAPLLNADAQKFNEMLQGSVVVLYLWGPWNVDSRSGYEKIREFHQRFAQSSRIQFVTVAFAKDLLDVEDLREQCREALGEAVPQLPVFYDPDGRASMELALLMPYGSLGFPTTMILDKSGTVKFVVEGVSSDDFAELEEFLIECSQNP